MSQAEQKIKPVLLIADSRLLFKKDLLNRFLGEALSSHLRAAYIGVSSGDDPVFFDLFTAAMEQLNVRDHLQITREFPAEQQTFLKSAHIILIGGGDTYNGWLQLQKSGINEVIVQRYYQGSFLIGVSAGAVQLGLYGLNGEGHAFRTLGILPLMIDVHDEKNDWHRLQKLLPEVQKDYLTGIGIPTGGGMLYHPEHEVEAVEHPLTEFHIREGKLRRQLILPKSYTLSHQKES